MGNRSGANTSGSAQAKYTTCSRVSVSGHGSMPSMASTPFVQASAATTSRAQRIRSPPASSSISPPSHDLAGIHFLELDPTRPQALRIVIHRDGRLGRPQVQPTGPHDQTLTQLALDLRPRTIGLGRERHIPGRVVGATDDPRVVLGRAPRMADLELLESDHVSGGPASQPVRGRAADAAQAQDGVGPLDGQRPVSASPPAPRAGSTRRQTSAGRNPLAIPPPPPVAFPAPGPSPSRGPPRTHSTSRCTRPPRPAPFARTRPWPDGGAVAGRGQKGTRPAT